jgi:hypothetical protein
MYVFLTFPKKYILKFVYFFFRLLKLKKNLWKQPNQQQRQQPNPLESQRQPPRKPKLPLVQTKAL